MSSQCKKPLGEILQFQRGFDLPTSQRESGLYPVISSSGFSGTHNEYKSDGENVVTGRYGTIGEIYYYNGKCWPLNTALFVKDFKGNLPIYIYYLLKHVLKVDGKDKSTVPGVNRNVLHMMKVPFYRDLSYQNKISKVLSVIDNKIQLNNRIHAELEEMAKTIYDYWFIQFDFPDENGKPYRSSCGEMVYNKELKRKIPKGWMVSTVGKRLDKVPNTAKIQSSEYKLSGCLPIIDQSTNYIAGYCDNSNAKVHTLNGAIIFGDHTRVVKFVEFDFARGADGTQVLLTNDERVIPQILFYQMIKNIDLSNYGYARHYKFLKDSLIIIPTESIAMKYKKTMKAMYEHITKIIFENQELVAIRNWLLPMLMNGQATVE